MTDQDNAVDIATINAQLTSITTTLAEIKTQTTLTNGRVTSLEATRQKAVGAWFAMSLLGPIVTGLVVGFILSQ